MRRLIAALLVLSLILLSAFSAFAAEQPETEEKLDASKTDLKTDKYFTDLQYEVTLSVPGTEDKDSYSEIIVMVDGSISNKYTEYYEAGSEFKAEMSLIKSIGQKTLREDGKIHLTVMGFGFSGKVVDTFTKPEELSRIDELTSDDFLYGVSATNCEGAMSFIEEYLKAQPDSIYSSVVVFASDGEANLDDEPFPLYDWRNHSEWWGGKTVASLVSVAAEFLTNELKAGYEPLDAAKRLYPDECIAIAAAKESGTYADVDDAIAALSAAINADTEKGASFIDACFSDAMAAYKNDLYPEGMEYEKSYPSSHLEHAIVDYFTNGDQMVVPAYKSYKGEIALDKNNNPDVVENCAYIFYLTVLNFAKHCEDYYYISRSTPDPITNQKYAQRDTTGLRAAAACDRLCELDKVSKLFLVGYPARTSTQGEHWMNPEATEETTKGHVTSPKAQFNFAAGSVEALGYVEDNFIEVLNSGFSDPYIVDPMSKWVKFDPETADIRIYDYDTCIYSSIKGGWLVEDAARPVKTKEPVKLELNEETGRYTLTWYVKDGKLSVTDMFSLKYYVTVDTQAEGYKMGTEYPANDETWLYYNDKAGMPLSSSVEIPPVAGPFTITKIWNDDKKSHDSVTVYLTKDGVKIADVIFTDKNWTDGSEGNISESGDLILNEENDWTVTVYGIPAFDENNELIEYELVEENIGRDYMCVIEGSAEEGFTVTNTSAVLPVTGDNTVSALWIAMFVLSLLSLAYIGLKRREA